MSKNIIYLLLIAIGAISSCSKDLDQGRTLGPTRVYVKLDGMEYDTEEANPDVKVTQSRVAKEESGKSAFDDAQKMLIPFGDEYQILAELVEDKSTNNANPMISGKQQNSKASTGAQKATINRFPLVHGVKYKILAYMAGVFIDERTVVHGQEASLAPFEFNDGVTYTFVAYSINSLTDLPEPLLKTTLATASIQNVTGDLMYFKTDLKVEKGDNNLSIILKHLFSEINLHISSGALGGKVDAVGPAKFDFSKQSASISLNTGALSYSTTTTSPIVTFPTGMVPATTVTANPILVISQANTTGKLTLNSLNINGLEKPLVIENLKVAPGKRYNLNLTVNAPCTEEMLLDSFNLVNGETKTFIAPPSDYGFIFDVFYCDNSLNLTINGQALLLREFWEETWKKAPPFYLLYDWVQTNHTNGPYDFQFVDLHTDVPPLVQNIWFAADQGRWGQTAGIKEIYFIKGDKDHPIFRIHIQKDGIIKLYGSRSDYGVLEPIEVWGEKRGPIANNDHKTTIRYFYQARLNPNIVWNKTGTNTVVASQVNSGPTNMRGRGYGRSRINCAP